MNARKSSRRWLAMLAVLIAISVLGDVVGLIVHYALRPVVGGGVQIAHGVPTKAAASSHIQ